MAVKNVLLKFRGPAGQRKAAESRLRVQVPGIVFTHRLDEGFEAELADEQLSRLTGLAEWSVTPVVYADINPPQLNLGRMRAKLSSGR